MRTDVLVTVRRAWLVLILVFSSWVECDIYEATQLAIRVIPNPSLCVDNLAPNLFSILTPSPHVTYQQVSILTQPIQALH